MNTRTPVYLDIETLPEKPWDIDARGREMRGKKAGNSADCAEETRDLECPHCGYRVYNNRGIGAVYCGPHIDGKGYEYPAVRMRELSRRWVDSDAEHLPVAKMPEGGMNDER